MDALYRLGRDFQDKNIAIRVAIHGLDKTYNRHDPSWIDLDSPDSLETLKGFARHYSSRNDGPWTDYTVALRGATNELDASGKGKASFTLPGGANPAFAGIAVHHAFVAIDLVTTPAAPGVGFTSEAVTFTFVP